VFPALFGDGAARAVSVFYEHFAANHLKGLRTMPGAEALLDVLAEQGIPLAVVSNKKGDLLRREIAHLGWAGRFRAVVGGQDAAADKPDPAPVYLAVAQANLVSVRDVWLVGDTDTDMHTAIAAGCIPVLVGEGPTDPTLLVGARPALRCDDCIALEGFVRRRGVTICESNGIGGQSST
jgi:phosphoglycolate phosphatase